MEMLLTVLVLGIAIYFWGIKGGTATKLDKNDLIKFFSEEKYFIIDEPVVWVDVTRNLKKMEKEDLYLEIWRKEEKFYKIWRDAAWDLLIGAMNENKCYFMQKDNDIIAIGEIRKVPFFIVNQSSKYFRKERTYKKICKFKDLKEGLGFTPREHFIDN